MPGLTEFCVFGVCCLVPASRADSSRDLTGPPVARRVAWQVHAVIAAVGLFVTAWLGRTWQGEQRRLLGMDSGVPWLWLITPLLGLAVAVVLLGIGRAVKGLGRVIFRPLGKVLPTRVASLLAIVVTVFVTWTVLSGVLVGNAISLADSIFEDSTKDDKPGVVNPESKYRSGGPESTVTWESIGREGRAFIHQGLTADEIASVVDDPAAVDPIRAFIGLETAPTATDRAQVAVAELRRLGGFERGAIAVAGGTGSGWIDPKAAKRWSTPPTATSPPSPCSTPTSRAGCPFSSTRAAPRPTPSSSSRR